LANFDEIERLDVAIGDSVWVVKVNDIIPKIVRVTDRPATRRPILAPVACPFCGGGVGRRRTTGGSDGVIIECRNAECPKKSTGKIRRWIASVDILGIGDGVLEALLDRFALEDAAGLYILHGRADELADLVINAERDLRLGQKRAPSILDAIDATRNRIDPLLATVQAVNDQLAQEKRERALHSVDDKIKEAQDALGKANASRSSATRCCCRSSN